MEIVLGSLHSGGNGLLAVLALVFAQSLCPALGPPVQDVLPVLVHLQLHDGHLARVDAHIDGGAVRLLPLDALDVNPGANCSFQENLGLKYR